MGAIALRPTGNAHGTYLFLNLRTGCTIKRLRWTELPLPEEVVQRVHTLARRSKARTGVTFAFHNGEEVHDEDDTDADPDYDPAEEDIS